jgi:transposase InsO family protein
MKGSVVIVNEVKAEQIANERYAFIAPVIKHLKEDLSHGEKYTILRTISSGNYEGLEKIGLRSLERYLALYEKGGISALKPKVRERSIVTPSAYVEATCKLKKENMSRSIDTIIFMLEESGQVPKGILKRSTVYDWFTKHKLTTPTRGAKTGRYTRYGALHRAEILQGDTHYTLKLSDPSRPGQERQVYLFAWIDDYTRLVYAQFYWKEQLPALEDSLKKWIILHGCPQNIYCDNGAVYSSHHLRNICGTLGIQLLHSRPYKPQGKGKCEKFFQFVESSFKSEVELLIREGKITNLTELNNIFTVWLNQFYNRRKHSATKQTPISRWEADETPLRKPTLETIYEAFLMKDGRSASKTGLISVETNEYEVEPFLCGKKIDIRYDPYDLSKGIRVYYEGKQYTDAIPAKVHRHSKKGFNAECSADDPPIYSSGINFLEQLAGEKFKMNESVKFSALNEEGDI